MKKRKKVIILFAIVVVAGIAALVFKVSGIYDPENNVPGNNQNVTWYIRELGAQAYGTIDEAMKSHNENYEKEKVLYMAHTGNVARVFMVNGDEVTGYEFIVKEEKYHYVGERKLIINGMGSEKEYEWEATLRSDLSYSTKTSYRNIINIGTKYMICPAWGVSDREQVRKVTFDGQAVDEVVEFSKGQETYYLWIIDDLKTKNNAVDVMIRF